MLISEPNLDKRTAALLGNLTNRGFLIVEERSLLSCAHSMAIYIGEHPALERIQHSIAVNITPTSAGPPGHPEWLRKHIEYIPRHLKQYREKNLDQVREFAFTPSGVPSESAAVARALGSCLVDAPGLQQGLVSLLTAEDKHLRSQRSSTVEAMVVGSALTLSRQEREHVYVSEITVEANRVLELRGERSKLSPETVGRCLRRLGLRSRRLTSAGNGLTFDTATLAVIEQLGAVYVEEDLLEQQEKLPCSQATENEKLEEVV